MGRYTHKKRNYLPCIILCNPVCNPIRVFSIDPGFYHSKMTIAAICSKSFRTRLQMAQGIHFMAHQTEWFPLTAVRERAMRLNTYVRNY